MQDKPGGMKLLCAGAALLAGVLGAPAAHAQAQSQTFPSRPVALVVPYAPGGGTDALARTMAKGLSALWGQPVIVENRVGADGWVGTQRVLAQPSDGYTILMQLNSIMLWKWALPEAKFEPLKDMRMVTKVQSSPMVAAVKGDNGAATLKEFFAECKRAAKPCSFGTSTVSAELVSKQLMELGGLTNGIQVPYKGTAPMMTDLLGDHISMAMLSANLAVPMTQEGKVKSLAVGSPARYPRLPASPTLPELGYAVLGNTWYGLMVKQGTPDAAFRAIVDGVQKISKQPEVLAAIAVQGGVPVFNTPQEFERDIREETKFLTPLGEKYLAPGATTKQ